MNAYETAKGGIVTNYPYDDVAHSYAISDKFVYLSDRRITYTPWRWSKLLCGNAASPKSEVTAPSNVSGFTPEIT